MEKIILVVVIIVITAVVIAGAVYFLQQPKVVQNTVSNQQSFNVTIQNFAFNPAELNIKKGQAATWTNRDSAPHQISGNGFKSGVLGNGQSYSFTFDNSGIFDYICSIHPYMKGKIIVQ